MSVLYATGFDGADANPIGAPFVSVPTLGGDIQRAGNVALGVGAGRNQCYVDGVTVPSHHYAAAMIGALGATLGGLMGGALAGIDTANGRCAMFVVADDGQAYLVDYDSTSGGSPFLTVELVGHTHAPGDVYACEVNGGDFRGLINGAVVTDPHALRFTPGDRAGILLRNTDCVGLALEIGDFAVAPTNIAGSLTSRGRLKSLTGGALCT